MSFLSGQKFFEAFVAANLFFVFFSVIWNHITVETTLGKGIKEKKWGK